VNLHTYNINSEYSTKVAYFSMEFAIHQALKVYSGGLGFLSGSHMRSVHNLGQNVIGVGMLWSYGYYDQGRDEHNDLRVDFIRKRYYFLDDLGIEVPVTVNSHIVWVKVYYLNPETFGTAPLLLLTTDYDKNDYLARTISYKLYDAYEDTRIAQEIVLGIGGVKALEALEQEIDIYHLNEGHAIPLAFELYKRYKTLEELRKHIVFTTHTPEAAGNETHNTHKLHKMGFFNGLSLEEMQSITGIKEDDFSLTLAALRVSKIANGVSKLHGKVANDMWAEYPDICEIISITNAQNRRYWIDKTLLRALDEHEDYELVARKKHLKKVLFDVVADQTGQLFDPDVLTIVWARRFAEYKRPGLLTRDFERFHRLATNQNYPVQIIWAGKPYPFDTDSIHIFNELVHISLEYKNVAVLTGYELQLSMLLKKGADIWLNTPRITREASGTSGMAAAMNGAVNFSINDGWVPEFAKDGINSFIIPADRTLPVAQQDIQDAKNMMDILENKILPMYYDDQEHWVEVIKNSMRDVNPSFDSGKMAHEYYARMYDVEHSKESQVVPEDEFL
jgi:glycogen phosphorylase